MFLEKKILEFCLGLNFVWDYILQLYFNHLILEVKRPQFIRNEIFVVHLT